MTDLNKRIDPLSFPILGLLGAFACGPSAPQDPDGSTGGGTDPTTDPSMPTTDPSMPTTEPPIPECAGDSDCEATYCGVCMDGRCIQTYDCGCGYEVGLSETKWRCRPLPDCYSDDDCAFGEACEFDICVEAQPIPLAPCEPPDGDASSWNLGNAPTAFILADLDGDKDLDLAAGEPASGSIEIAVNDGAGNFVLAGAFGVGPVNSGDLALAAGDIDGDGDLDLAVTRREPNGVLRLLFNDGAVFTVGEPRPTVSLPEQVFLADVNGDGALDVFTVGDGAETPGLQLGDGKGQFAAEQPGLPENMMARASVLDFSMDGSADLLAPGPGGGGFTAWIGNGRLLSPIRSFDVPRAANIAALSGDVDVNGFQDVVVVAPQADTGLAHVWTAIASTEWTPGHRRYITTRPLIGGLMAELTILPGADLVAATGQNNIVVLPGNGQGNFDCELIFDLTGPSAPDLLAVGDVDGDGLFDIVAGGLGVTDIAVISPKF